MRANTIKIYDGPSLIDEEGRRIVVLLSGLKKASTNTKTGDMLQTWILLYDTPPHHAVKTGDDSAVCGDCPLRPTLFKRDEVSTKSCYVRVFQAPRSVWKANRDLPVTPLHEVRAMVGGRKVRVGSYGDPMAVPPIVWDATGTHTGYSHQWRSPFRLMGRHVMASVHTLAEREQAKQKGYRTFRIIDSVDDVVPGEILCPASKEAGHRTTCERCQLCNGRTGIADNRKDIAIVAH